jgi:very-short-patch-repair endonuclease
MKFKLDKTTIKKIRAVRRANKAQEELRSGKSLSRDQKNSLKCRIATGLRHCPTKAETVLKRRIEHLGFKFNDVVFGYIPDFSNSQHKIVVEVDGSVHLREEVKRRDSQKDAAFERMGWIMLRFSNLTVLEHLDMVIEKIKETVRLRARGII